MDNANKIQDMYESYELEVEELELQGTRKLAETIIIYKNKNNTLNKGIDELLIKYEEMSVHDYTFIKNILQDLKNLKGE